MSRRPIRFFHHRIDEQGTLWLDGDTRLVSADWDSANREWNVVLVEYGTPQDIDEDNGRAQFGAR